MSTSSIQTTRLVALVVTLGVAVLVGEAHAQRGRGGRSGGTDIPSMQRKDLRHGGASPRAMPAPSSRPRGRSTAGSPSRQIQRPVESRRPSMPERPSISQRSAPPRRTVQMPSRRSADTAIARSRTNTPTRVSKPVLGSPTSLSQPRSSNATARRPSPSRPSIQAPTRSPVSSGALGAASQRLVGPRTKAEASRATARPLRTELPSRSTVGAGPSSRSGAISPAQIARPGGGDRASEVRDRLRAALQARDTSRSGPSDGNGLRQSSLKDPRPRGPGGTGSSPIARSGGSDRASEVRDRLRAALEARNVARREPSGGNSLRQPSLKGPRRPGDEDRRREFDLRDRILGRLEANDGPKDRRPGGGEGPHPRPGEVGRSGNERHGGGPGNPHVGDGPRRGSDGIKGRHDQRPADGPGRGGPQGFNREGPRHASQGGPRHPHRYTRPWRHSVSLPVAHPHRNYYRRYAGHKACWFGPTWHHRPSYWNRWCFGHHPWHYWWGCPTWNVLTGWVTWGWSYPIYYDYGTNVIFQNGYVCYDGTQVITVAAYVAEAEALAEKGQEALGGEVELAEENPWQPLGVFALLKPGEEQPQAFLQLAVTKDGIIGGTYYLPDDENKTEPITGAVDPETQRAAWFIGEDRDEIMEAGIANLTRDETPVLIHLKDKEPLTWRLVRQAEPAETE